MNARKGQHFVRKSDGFVFVVVNSSRKAEGAMLKCVDAERIFGWFTFETIARDFARMLAEDFVYPVYSYVTHDHVVVFTDKQAAITFVARANNPLRGVSTMRLEHAAKGYVR